MNIVVLAGGLSPERDVSLSSGSLVANALIENGHRVLLLDLYKGLDFDGSINDVFIDADSLKRYSFSVPDKQPNLRLLIEETDNDDALIGKNVVKLCKYADLVFIALHGDIGENGKLQAVFDSFGVQYTGSGYIGSLLAMDKDLSKKLMRGKKILTPDWIAIKHRNNCRSADTSDGASSRNRTDAQEIADAQGIADAQRIADMIGFPCVIKPCSCGSSVGVSIVNDADELERAFEVAGEFDNIIIVEKYVKGREFSVGILGGETLPPIEIIPKEGFYDYVNKYQAGMAQEICPANISDDVSRMLQLSAKQVHDALRLGDYSRIEFILDGDNNAYCLEANTLPGMTPTSLLPQEAAVKGISYNELCEKIVELATRRG